MSADRIRVECVFQDDARLLQGISVIVSHTAQSAGIPEKARAVFAEEALDACRKALASDAQKHGDSAIRFLVDHFPDRVEITLEYPGAPIALRQDGAKHHGADRVNQESSDGHSRIRLTKYCVAVDSKHRD